MMSKEFIKSLIDGCDGDLTAERIAEHLHGELKLIEDTKAGVRYVNTALNDENKRHEAKRSELDEKLKGYQKRCKHWSRVYHPDPSGNSDSYYECIVCGKCL